MDLQEIIDDMQQSVQEAHVALGRELSRIRTGRANAALLDGIRIDYYGTQTPLNQCASVLVPEPRLIVIKPWDRSIIKDVEKAIQTSDLGLTPSSDGEVVRIPIPTLTEERRRDLVKASRKHGEEHKVSIRNSRRDANELIRELIKDGDAPEDEGHKAMKKIQEFTDEGVKKVEQIVEEKEADIME